MEMNKNVDNLINKGMSEIMVSNYYDANAWLKVWTDNYNNNSEAAADIDKLMKKNYKSHNYVPWATMQKWLYILDPYATLDVIEEYSSNPYFTTKTVVETTTVKDGVASSTTVTKYTFFVKVRCVFLGKEFIEVYPIQDNAYNAPNFVDSNMVNKALQRAKAKVISAATGLAYRLYETGDLQFEDDSKDTIKTTTNKDNKKPVKNVVEVKDDVKNDNVVNDAVVDLAKYIIDNKDTLVKVLQDLNPSIISKYGKDINPAKGLDDVIDTLSNISNIEIFGKTLKTRHKANKA